ncbi:MAG: hypothetical protein AABN33_06535 [Acidobacteriota bacterium]
MKIVSFDPTESAAGKLFNQQPDGTSAMRVIPSRVNRNLLFVFDQSVLPTVVANDAIMASIPPSLYATKHTIYVVDSVTGETSPPVIFTAGNLDVGPDPRFGLAGDDQLFISS